MCTLDAEVENSRAGKLAMVFTGLNNLWVKLLRLYDVHPFLFVFGFLGIFCNGLKNSFTFSKRCCGVFFPTVFTAYLLLQGFSLQSHSIYVEFFSAKIYHSFTCTSFILLWQNIWKKTYGAEKTLLVCVRFLGFCNWQNNRSPFKMLLWSSFSAISQQIYCCRVFLCNLIAFLLSFSLQNRTFIHMNKLHFIVTTKMKENT